MKKAAGRSSPPQATPHPLMEDRLNAVSPIDGRYTEQTVPLRALFSEKALIGERISIELGWFRRLAAERAVPGFEPLSADALAFLEDVQNDTEDRAALRVKELERTTRHDVKAVEYYLKQRLDEHPELRRRREYVHFACTSEDINNLAYAGLMLRAREECLMPRIGALADTLVELAVRHADRPMLARTHGQAASPTTLGKEIAVYAHRLRRQIERLGAVRIGGKINGAVGNYNAHLAACPETDWPALARLFVESDLQLHWNPCTTQIEPHDWMAEYFHALSRCNVTLIDLCRDAWGYISLGYLRKRSEEGEVGSSTMPHKINPIEFENAEGNLGLSNALLSHLADTLPVSRWQRDLVDSTRQRNVGVALGHALIAWESCRRGLGELEADDAAMDADLESAWEVLTEAVQTVMRRHGLPDPYERLKKIARGHKLTREDLHAFIRGLDLPQEEKNRLLALRPADYIGNAATQARQASR